MDDSRLTGQVTPVPKPLYIQEDETPEEEGFISDTQLAYIYDWAADKKRRQAESAPAPWEEGYVQKPMPPAATSTRTQPKPAGPSTDDPGQYTDADVAELFSVIKDGTDYAASVAAHAATLLIKEEAATLLERHLYGGDELKLSTEAEIHERPSPEWWLEGLIQKNTIAVIAGTGGTGKTFLCLDIARRVAAGVPFMDGRAVSKGRVLYVAAEGTAAFGDRVRAWDDFYKHEVPADGITYVESGVNLSSDVSVDRLGDVIEAGGYDLVFLDTLSQLGHVEDENHAGQNRKVFTNLKRLRDRNPGSAVVVVHHSNAAGTKARGSTLIRDNADTAIIVAAQGDGFSLSTRVSDNGKQKDGAGDKFVGFKLTSHLESAVVTYTGRANSNPMWEPVRMALADGAAHPSADLRTACGITGTSGPEYDRFKAFIAKLAKDGVLIKSGPSNRPAYQLTIVG